MINMYKKRTITSLLGIIIIVNIVLISIVFFAFSSIVKKDYTEKITYVARQTAINANSILSFFEEEIEVFINKYNVENGLESFKLDSPNFIRMDSTSFENISIYKDTEPVYSSGVDVVDFYRNTGFDKKMVAFSEERTSGWIINEEKEPMLNQYESLIYVRTLFDTDTKEKIGCVVAQVSQKQLKYLLKLSSVNQESEKKEFLPHSVGICVNGKIFFLSENNAVKIMPDIGEFKTGKNEMCFVNFLGEKKFITVHSTIILIGKISMMLFLFIFLFLVITIFSYRMLNFMVNEISERIDKLNFKIENYGDKSL